MNQDNPTKDGKRTEETLELMRTKALERGSARSIEVRQRVKDAMTAIQVEMASNDGIYPQNKGAVSAAEVARRAGVHPTTFFSPKQRELGDEVRVWLESLKKQKVVGRGPVRRALAERIADWRQLYEGLAQSHRDTELQLQQTESDLDKARRELEEVTHERDALRRLVAASAGSNVVPIIPRKK